MEFYARIEPAGEFATGIFDTRKLPNPTIEDIEMLQVEEQEENDIVRVFGLPVYLYCEEEDLEDAKEEVLNLFDDMPEEGREKINWNINTIKPKRFHGLNEDESENPELFNEDNECYEKGFTFAAYSKGSVEMDFGEDIDLSKLTIDMTYVQFHYDYLPEEINSMYILTNISYEDSDVEFEIVDRGYSRECNIIDYDWEIETLK